MQLIYLIVGWPLGWIMWACYKVVPVYAVALVLFTLIMRVLLVPFSIKQQKSMVKKIGRASCRERVSLQV